MTASEPPADLRAGDDLYDALKETFPDAASMSYREGWRDALDIAAQWVDSRRAALSGDRREPPADLSVALERLTHTLGYYLDIEDERPRIGLPSVAARVVDHLLADAEWAANFRAALSGDRPSPDHATPRGFPSHEADCHCHAAVARYAAVASPATAPAEGLDVERLAKALACEDPEEPCDADGRDEHRWCDYCIARSVVSRPAVAAEYARLAPDSAQEAE